MKRLSTMAENALINARRAKECKNYRQARSYYRSVLTECPEHWEAFFYSTYCEAIELDISRGAKTISNCVKLVLNDIKKLEDTIKQNEAIKQIYADLNDYFYLLYRRAVNSHIQTRGDVLDKISTAGIFLGAEKRNIKVLDKVDNIAFDYFYDLTYMLTLFVEELVSEFGENELTISLKRQCYETLFEILPTRHTANILKKLRSSLPAFVKYENRDIFKKLWEKHYTNGNGMNKFCIWLFIFCIIVAIFVLLTQEPIDPDPVRNELTQQCQRRYYDDCISGSLSYYVNGQRMYANGSDKKGGTILATLDEWKQVCRKGAIERGCKYSW
jgi:hypothetical protein